MLDVSFTQKEMTICITDPVSLLLFYFEINKKPHALLEHVGNTKILPQCGVMQAVNIKFTH